MRRLVLVAALSVCVVGKAAELESRALTHYVPQDLLESIVRKEGWTEIVLKPYNGVRKGDIARIWAGGVIDRGNGGPPGQNVSGAFGMGSKGAAIDPGKLSLSSNPQQAFALLFKTEDEVARTGPVAGKPLEVPLTKDSARFWIGFNDEKGRFGDNHLGQGRRHELDPLWVRVEVIRIIVD